MWVRAQYSFWARTSRIFQRSSPGRPLGMTRRDGVLLPRESSYIPSGWHRVAGPGQALDTWRGVRVVPPPMAV